MTWSIEDLEPGDVALARKMISSSPSVAKDCHIEDELDDHIGHDRASARKLVVNGKMVGVYAIEFNRSYIGLSFLYINPEWRSTMIAFRFCKDLFKQTTKDKPILTIADNIDVFKKHVTHSIDNVYIVHGLR
jgi:hypothetical protein